MVRRALSVLALATCALGCGTTSSRFGSDVQTAVAQASMRRMETEHLVVYYPEGSRAEAERAATRIETCEGALRKAARIHTSWSDQKPRFVLPALPYNNAYVEPADGSEPIGVVPTYATTDFFSLLGMPPDPGTIACHEVVHYVHFLQSAGFNGFMTTVFGPAYSPQMGLDPWFDEGLAVYYETKLQGGIGRLGNRYFEGILAAGAAETGIDTGMFHVAHRTPLYGGQYLIGARFIDWLAGKYGEDKLWQVIEREGKTALFLFGLEGRFSNVYGKGLTALAKEFAADFAARHPAAERPRDQRALYDAGQDARYARSRTGLDAIVTHDLDAPVRLVVRDAGGRVLVERNLTDVLPGRSLVAPSTAMVSGLSFTADGARLFFVVADRGPTLGVSKLVAVDVASGKLEVVADDLGGPGGSIAPDGRRYYFARAQGDAYGVASLDLVSKRTAWIRVPEIGHYHTGVRVSPNGARLVVTSTDRTDFRVTVLDAKTGAVVREITPRGGFAMNADWVDDDRVVYAAEVEGRMQALVAGVASGAVVQATRAPYLAIAPQSDGRTVRFLNRVGWRWSVDEVALAPEAAKHEPMVVVDIVDDAPRSHAYRARTRPADAPPRVQEDAPYSPLEHLFVPQVRGPWIAVRSLDASYGIGVNGGDRLGLHRWGVGIGYEPRSSLFSGELQYIDADLAPVWVVLDAAHYGQREAVDTDQGVVDVRDAASGLSIDAQENLGRLTVQRTWFGSTTLGTGLRYDELRRSLAGAGTFEVRRFGGYSASLAYYAAERTAYTGPRRAFGFGLRGTMFPKIFDEQRFALGDGAASLDATVPVVLRRLLLDVEVRGRYLAGAPRGASLLQVGGAGGAQPPGSSTVGLRPIGDDPSGSLPPGLRFFEPLSGYEDLARFDRGAAIGEAQLRVPLVIDWGSLSSAWLFPSFLLRQIDLAAFATGAAFVDTPSRSGAAGGRVTLATMFWLVPISVRVQVAKRLADDESVATYVTVLAE